jgi:hypothetical protein
MATKQHSNSTKERNRIHSINPNYKVASPMERSIQECQATKQFRIKQIA